MDSVSLVNLALATAVVVGLLAAFSFSLKYMASRGWVVSVSGKANRRMRHVETLPLDTRRRLVIVECDGVEHLLLLGLNQDVVVASPLPSVKK